MLQIIKNNILILKQVYRAYPAYIYASLLATVTKVVAPLTSVLGVKLLLDALTGNKPFSYIAGLILLYAALGGGAALVNAWYANSHVPRAQAIIMGAINNKLMEKAAGLDLSCFEDPGFYDRYMRAIGEANNRAAGVVATVAGLVGNLLSLGTLAVIIISMDPMMLALAAAGVAITFVIDIGKSRIHYRFEMERTAVGRRIAYIQRVFYEPQYAKEIRLFDLSIPFMARYLKHVDSLSAMLRRQGRKLFSITGFEGVLNEGLFILVVLLYLAFRVTSGKISIGSFTALINGTFQIGMELSRLIGRIPELYRHSLYIENLLVVLNYRPKTEKRGGVAIEPGKPHSLEFRNVSYTYRGQDRASVRNLNLKINAGEHIAVVGYNGAGKSTLTKLLMRLYEPDEGDILIDGTDIKEMDIASLRESFSIVTQDFQHYAFSVAENVLPNYSSEDEEKVQTAIVQAGLEDKIAKLPHGIYTPVSREFDEDGVMFSGGEFQKLALARAFARGSGVLVLDEPSSALDPVSEHELFERIKECAKGKTVLFICHKLSAARNADRIVVLENGTVIEEGTHDQLVEAGGKYAALFMLQAEPYGAPRFFVEGSKMKAYNIRR